MRIQSPIAFVLASSTGLLAQGDPFPEVGKSAPTATVKDHDGHDVTIGGKSKTWTVLAFYPKALTGG
jgi:hypothetical protein